MTAAFYVAAVIAVVATAMVIVGTNAVHALLNLVVSLLAVAIVFYVEGAPFAAALEVIVYAGAIMVLFLFVITLLGTQDYPFMSQHLPGQRPLSIIFAALLLLSIVFFVGQAPHALNGLHGTFNNQLAAGNVAAFGVALFTQFVFPFEGTTLLLIVAMVGAVALGRKRERTEEQ